jgi:hypothetical protein
MFSGRNRLSLHLCVSNTRFCLIRYCTLLIHGLVYHSYLHEQDLISPYTTVVIFVHPLKDLSASYH